MTDDPVFVPIPGQGNGTALLYAGDQPCADKNAVLYLDSDQTAVQSLRVEEKISQTVKYRRVPDLPHGLQDMGMTADDETGPRFRHLRSLLLLEPVDGFLIFGPPVNAHYDKIALIPFFPYPCQQL